MDTGELARYPHYYPPPGFIQFDRNGLIQVAAGPPIVGQVLETILITSNYEGWVRTIGLEAGDWSIVSLSLLSGGQPIRDYTNIVVPLGSPTTPKEVYIPLVPNYPLQLVLNSTGAGAVPVRWNLWGWQYKVGG